MAGKIPPCFICLMSFRERSDSSQFCLRRLFSHLNLKQLSKLGWKTDEDFSVPLCAKCGLVAKELLELYELMEQLQTNIIFNLERFSELISVRENESNSRSVGNKIRKMTKDKCTQLLQPYKPVVKLKRIAHDAISRKPGTDEPFDDPRDENSDWTPDRNLTDSDNDSDETSNKATANAGPKSQVSPTSSLTCKQCKKRFAHKRFLMTHIRQNCLNLEVPKDSRDKWKCQFCPKSFPDQNCLLKHQLVAHPYHRRHNIKVVPTKRANVDRTCAFCQYKCSSYPLLELHMTSKHPGNYLSSYKPESMSWAQFETVCQEELQLECQAFVDMRIESIGTRMHSCPYCGHQTKLRAKRARHLITRHSLKVGERIQVRLKKLVPNQELSTTRPKTRNQNNADVETDKNQAFQESPNTVPTETPQGKVPSVCALCGKTYKDAKELKRHKTEFHPHLELSYKPKTCKMPEFQRSCVELLEKEANLCAQNLLKQFGRIETQYVCVYCPSAQPVQKRKRIMAHMIKFHKSKMGSKLKAHLNSLNKKKSCSKSEEKRTTDNYTKLLSPKLEQEMGQDPINSENIEVDTETNLLEVVTKVELDEIEAGDDDEDRASVTDLIESIY